MYVEDIGCGVRADEVRPCPFCGATPIVAWHKMCYSVECLALNSFPHDAMASARDKREAIKLWNTRVSNNDYRNRKLPN